MLTFLPAPLIGIIALLLYAAHLILIAILIVLVGTLGLLIPYKPWRQALDWLNHAILPNLWVAGNNAIMRLTTRTEWEIRSEGVLDPKGWYLVVCNHQSWLDILLLEKIFYRKLPMLKFFMKKQLLWLLPVAGVACWMLGFPFMQRYSKSYLKKHPEKKGKDIETTRRACEKFKNQPIAIINFVEGTRFTQEKQQRQAAPYRHLLTPRAGGFAFAMAAMQNHLSGVIDTTIIYPEPNTTIWRFMCGQVRKIIVHYRVVAINPELIGDFENDPDFTRRFQRWLNEVWKTKDETITTALLKGSTGAQNSNPYRHP